MLIQLTAYSFFLIRLHSSTNPSMRACTENKFQSSACILVSNLTFASEFPRKNQTIRNDLHRLIQVSSYLQIKLTLSLLVPTLSICSSKDYLGSLPMTLGPDACMFSVLRLRNARQSHGRRVRQHRLKSNRR